MPSYLVTCEYDDDDHYLDLEIYLTYDDERPDAGELTQADVEAVMREIVSTGEVPEGWTVELVQWNHGAGEREGGAGDLGAFDTIVKASELGVEPLPPGPAEQGDDDDDGEGEV